MIRGQLSGMLGMRYARTQRVMWSGQCPYNMSHCKKLNKPDWEVEMKFERWHKLGERCRFRRPCVYKLFWRLNSNATTGKLKG